MARTLPRNAEVGGGLMVAIIQLSIMGGAMVGGALFDAMGYRATFNTSAGLLIIAAVLVALTARAVQGTEFADILEEKPGDIIFEQNPDRSSKSRCDGNIASA